MNFKIKISDAIKDNSLKSFFDFLMNSFTNYKINNIKRTEDKIEFKSNLFKGISNWNVFYLVNSANVSFNKSSQTIDFNFSILFFLIYSILAGLFLALLMQNYMVLVLVLTLALVNSLICYFRLLFFVKNLIKDFNPSV